MAVELVTGYSGERHVTSSDDGARQAGTVGTGMYALMTVEEPLKAVLENANTVTVGPGDVLINGRHVRLTGSTTFAVPVGTQGMQTSNLLVLRYELAEDETESVTAVTLTGEPAASDPADPALATGSILDGDSPVDMPLYRVVTTGIESAQPVRLFATVKPVAELGLADLDGTLPVSKGGTGATTADAARRSLMVPAVAGEATAASVYCDDTYDQRVMVQVSGPGGRYMTVAADQYMGLYDNDGTSWVWQLWPNDASKGLLRAGRGNVFDLSFAAVYGLAPGTYLVANTATNGPESGQYGNLLVSYSAGNRVVALLSYDGGGVWAAYGATSSGNLNWKRLDNGAYVRLLWSGTWSSGAISVPGSSAYRMFALRMRYENSYLTVPACQDSTGLFTASTVVWWNWGGDIAFDYLYADFRRSGDALTASEGHSIVRLNTGSWSVSKGGLNVYEVWGVV